MSASTLQELLAQLKNRPILPLPDGESWSDMICRTTTPGRVAQITEETYDYFLEVLPPRWMGRGFAFGEGADPLRLFWQAGPDVFCCRQLSDEENVRFCRLANIPLTSG
jgi:hypothetical protein